MPEATQGYKLSQPKQSLAEYQQMGKYLAFLSRLYRCAGTGSRVC